MVVICHLWWGQKKVCGVHDASDIVPSLSCMPWLSIRAIELDPYLCFPPPHLHLLALLHIPELRFHFHAEAILYVAHVLHAMGTTKWPPNPRARLE
jgi:hypothetical protein